MVSWSEMPRSPGRDRVGTDRGRLRRLRRGGLPALLRGQDGGGHPGATSDTWWATSRVSTLSVGWSGAADSLKFLLLEMRERVPDHSWLSRTRARLPHEVHTAVFDGLALIARRASASGWMPRPWRPTRRCASADTGEGYCWSARRAVSRHPRLRNAAQGQEALEPVGFQEHEATLKDGTTHLAYKTEHAVDLDTGWWRRSCTRPTRAIRQRDPGGGRGKPRGGGCGADGRRSGRMCDRGLPLTVGEGARDGPWKSRISEPEGFCALTEMMRLAGRSPTTGPGGAREAAAGSTAHNLDYAPDLASGPRERAQAIPASRPATTYRC